MRAANRKFPKGVFAHHSFYAHTPKCIRKGDFRG